MINICEVQKKDIILRLKNSTTFTVYEQKRKTNQAATHFAKRFYL